jgi:hypothetical protein
MKQADLSLNLTTKRMRKREFVAQMERVVPGGAVAPYAPAGSKGRPPLPVETMLRIHFMRVVRAEGATEPTRSLGPPIGGCDGSIPHPEGLCRDATDHAPDGRTD